MIVKITFSLEKIYLYSAGYKFADVWSDVTTMILAPFICTLDGYTYPQGAASIDPTNCL